MDIRPVNASNLRQGSGINAECRVVQDDDVLFADFSASDSEQTTQLNAWWTMHSISVIPFARC